MINHKKRNRNTELTYIFDKVSSIFSSRQTIYIDIGYHDNDRVMIVVIGTFPLIAED